jgi:hypothetical protein
MSSPSQELFFHMNKSIEIVYKLVIAFMSIYVFYRFIIPLIVKYLNDRRDNKKSSGKSIDQMIREKEAQLRASSTSRKDASKKGKEKQDLTIDLLLQQYKKKLEHIEDEQEYTPVIDLLENLQWGESDSTKRIISIAHSKYSINIDAININKSLKENFKLDFFQELPPFSEIINFFISYSLLSKMMDQNTAKIMAQEIEKEQTLIGVKHIIRGTHILVIKYDLKKDFSQKHYQNLITNESPVFKKSEQSKKISILNTVFNLGEKRVITPKYLMEKIREESLIIMATTPMEAPENPTIDEALKLFKIQNKKYLEKKMLKKTYKNFAQICHPDKLIGAKLPKELLEVANKNFIKIKNSFDILIKEI